MRVRNYAIGRCAERRRRWQQATCLFIFLDVGDDFVFQTIAGVWHEEANISSLLHRSKRFSCVVLNLNSLSDLELTKDYRFKLPEMKVICDALAWGGATARNRYVCDPMVAVAVLLFRLSTPNRCFDSEMKFRLFSSHLSEIF